MRYIHLKVSQRSKPFGHAASNPPPIIRSSFNLVVETINRLKKGVVEWAKDCAIIIEGNNISKDPLDLPPDQLKRIVKGIVWRDEHFAGETLRDIAAREKHGENYVNRCIQESFKFLSV